MLTVFFHWEGVVHHEYAPPGQTINKECYLNVLHWLRDAMQWNGHSYGQLVSGSFITTMYPLMHQVSCRVSGKTSNHPGDSAPLQTRLGALWLLVFPKTKITSESGDFRPSLRFRKIPTKDFAECFEQWKKCWESWVRFPGAYFEGDWGVIVLCTMFLVPCIFFSMCLYFSHYMAGYFLLKHLYLFY